MPKPEPIQYTLYAVWDNDDEPELQSVHVVDTGGKRLSATERADLAFGCKKSIERGAYSTSPTGAWLEFAQRKRMEAAALEKDAKQARKMVAFGERQARRMQSN